MAMWGNISMPRWKNLRDIMLFLAGMAGVFHETVVVATERPTLLLMFAAMMGLPAFLRTDEKDQDDEQEQEQRTSDEGLEIMRKAIEEQKRRNGVNKSWDDTWYKR